MSLLAQNVARWIGRVELVARGADDERQQAEEALAKGNPLDARVHALSLLGKVPSSPIGFALLVDACEAAWLYEEAAAAMRALCDSAPWRGELWLRLADIVERASGSHDEIRAACLKALETDLDATFRRQVLLRLVDLDLSAGDPQRASKWLDGLRLVSTIPEVALRRLEVGLAQGDRGLVDSSLRDLPSPGILDARANLAIGRARSILDDPGAIDFILRAFVLGAQGASQAIVSFVVKSKDAAHVARIREVLQAAGCVDESGFAFAVAVAEGRQDDAKSALTKIAQAGDVSAAWALYGFAMERGDVSTLRVAVDFLGDKSPRDGQRIVTADDAVGAGRYSEALDGLDEIDGNDAYVQGAAQSMRVRCFRQLVERSDDASASLVLKELRRCAASQDRFDLVSACESIAVERRRPLRVAVVGEFNAGKSTFINALLGADVAPTGIVPTTATMHWLSWAPDPFARIIANGRADRIVGHDALKDALRELQRDDETALKEVHICAPIEELKRIEILDTPGFNTPDERHAQATRRAIYEAHVVMWIIDASQPLKESERRVLAEIAAVGTPIQVLVNKCDRLDPSRVQGVLEHVTAGLKAVGLDSMGPVFGLSARLALRGRLGDGAALAQSGWDVVEQNMSQVIVGRREQLQHAAIRRKLLGLATGLVPQSQPLVLRTLDEAGQDKGMVACADRLASLADSDVREVVQGMAGALAALEEDLRPLRVAQVQMHESHAQAYVQARASVRLVGPLVQGLLAIAGWPARDLSEGAVWGLAWVVRGAIANATGPARASSLVSDRVVRASAQALGAAIREGAACDRKHEAAATQGLRRVMALRDALAQGVDVGAKREG